VAALEFRIETMADRTTRGVKVAGELDSATCDKLAEAVEQAIADLRVEQLVLDMREISFIDSAGLRTMLLIEQSAAQRGLALTVHPPPEEMMELLQLTGVGARLDFSRNAPASSCVTRWAIVSSAANWTQRR
jgi:anti-anti-sigma factor